MLGELVQRIRKGLQRLRQDAGDDVLARITELRETALDEKELLEQDGRALAQRIRRNNERARHAFGGERPL